VGYDGSKGGKAALERAAVAAKNNHAQLTAIWVRQPVAAPRGFARRIRRGSRKLPPIISGNANARWRKWRNSRELKSAAESRSGHAAKVIVNFAKDGGYDLIIIGHSDHSELLGRLLGDTADRISDHAHCSVLIVKQ